MRSVHDEIRKLATEIAAFPGSLEVATQTMKVAELLAGVPSRSKTALAVRGLDPLKDGWWAPPHNLALRQASMGLGVWTFTILPYFPHRRAYREDLNSIVIRPLWRLKGPAPDGLTKTASESFRSFPTVPDTVDKELSWMEERFGIKIPKPIRGALVANSLDQAQRRWAAKQALVKDRLIPLDGALPRDLL